ncbi:serine/threonine-protein kinase [Glycomyces terrestris]|uniref:non-specific serine/threonine protein kinase n=1 Tax=Glycomyces terrestris TaxID=2493553 RepID=A0A426URZ5_9ACTN|nr:serine/threonine-protein kinase [Glycomyces terrestris]RRR95858.1 serine/threonine protein kinase [Glycomyces terrestris]
MLSTRNLKAGDVLDGRYRLERRIGGGGMGDVWEGTDTILWRTVAVKVLLADLVDDRGFRERFRREARAIAVMQGPGVVEVYDYGEIEDEDAQLAYLIMEYVDGKPLSKLLGLWGKLGTAETLQVVGGVAEALQVAHAAGIVHRDIKPGNILVRGDGSVVLVDFGIARASHNLTLTTTGVVLGTVTYMSPEQAAGENLTPASDLYSLGVVAHQCLAGAPPFRADTPLGVLSAHLRNAPPPLPSDVPYEVAEIVRRSLQKEPSARWPDAAALAAACRETRGALLAQRNAPARTRVMDQRDMNEQPPAPPAGPRTGAHRRPTGAAARAATGQHAAYGTGPQSPYVSGQHPRYDTGQSLPPVTGAQRAAQPPTGPAAAAPAPVEERPQRRRLWIALAAAVAAIAAAGLLITTEPWREASGDGATLANESGAEDAELQGQDGDDGFWVGGDGEEEGASTPDPSESATAVRESDPSGDPASPGPSLSPTGSASPTESSSPTPPAKATVPGVVGMSEADARVRTEESGLSPSVDYEGEGEAKCGVVRQSPGAGTEVDPGSTVQITVRRAADAEACKSESEESEPPGDGQ